MASPQGEIDKHASDTTLLITSSWQKSYIVYSAFGKRLTQTSLAYAQDSLSQKCLYKGFGRFAYIFLELVFLEKHTQSLEVEQVELQN